MGLAVKTDGAAVASGAITESLILAKNAAEGIHYQPGWILGTAATVKVFIDIFIGVWAFVLGYIWTTTSMSRRTPTKPNCGNLAALSQIHHRLRDHVHRWAYLALGTPADIAKNVPAAIGEANTFRVIFFILTSSRSACCRTSKRRGRRVCQARRVYFVSLYGFVIWVGLLISWIFFHGITPPLAS